ncbi:Ribosomal protein L18e/L15P [Phytophthora cactorum]|nr:Ribosomal protein L18e/L15P [Phytophthora cactorum]
MSNIGSGKGKTSGHGHLEQRRSRAAAPVGDPASKEQVCDAYGDSEPGQPAALRGHGSPRHQQQDHHKELVIPGLATCSHVKHGIKLLGNGSQHLTAKLDIEVSQASESGFKAVEAASGSITSVYHNRLALRALHKRRSSRYPAAGASEPQKLTYYTNYGYLSLEIQVKKALANASNSE